MFPFSTVNSTAIPWDFVLILVVLGTLIPWRGTVRLRRFLRQPELTTADRLSLYASTIAFQWIIAGIVFWRAISRGLSLGKLGVTLPSPWQTTGLAVILTALLCALQFAGLRRTMRMPAGERGRLFQITEKIMPRSFPEVVAFAALACTAGISEELIYRGFVYAVFSRAFAEYLFPAFAAVILSAAWFAVAHLYQGPKGILTTFVVGIIFAFSRVYSGSLLPSVVAHAGVDLLAGLYMARFGEKI